MNAKWPKFSTHLGICQSMWIFIAIVSSPTKKLREVKEGRRDGWMDGWLSERKDRLEKK